MPPIIEVKDLTKEFRTFRRREGVLGALQNLFVREHVTVRAVDHVSFAIEPGEMVGYIGANGAGKSTTIKVLTDILVPTSGHVVSNGFVPYRERRRYTKHIGVVFGQRTQLWWDIAVIESFKLLKEIYEIPERDYRQRLDMFSDLLNLREYLHTPVRKLSLGERMRCDLAASLLHNPPLLFLDEPTIGLDVVAKDRIREFMKEVNRTEGTTVLLTTHAGSPPPGRRPRRVAARPVRGSDRHRGRSAAGLAPPGWWSSADSMGSPQAATPGIAIGREGRQQAGRTHDVAWGRSQSFAWGALPP